MFGKTKQLEAKIEALTDELTPLHNLVKAIDRSLAMIEFTVDGTILKVNQNFCDVIGYQANQVIGQHHRTLCDDEYIKSEEYKQFWKRLEAGNMMDQIHHGARNVVSVVQEMTEAISTK
jgi:methyl-accepting chemotaxis protein